MANLVRVSLVALFILFTQPSGQAGEIHDTVSRRDMPATKSLLDSNPALVNAKEEFTQRTPLLVAVHDGNRELVEFLLSRKADVNAEGMGGWIGDVAAHQF